MLGTLVGPVDSWQWRHPLVPARILGGVLPVLRGRSRGEPRPRCSHCYLKPESREVISEAIVCQNLCSVCVCVWQQTHIVQLRVHECVARFHSIQQGGRVFHGDIQGADSSHCREGQRGIFTSSYWRESSQCMPPARGSLRGSTPLSWGGEWLTFLRQVLLIAHYLMTFSMWHIPPGNAAKSFSSRKVVVTLTTSPLLTCCLNN